MGKPASAQDGEASTAGEEASREQARALFSEGVTAMGAEDFETAAARFEAALALHSAPTLEYNLASAYFELGRIGESGDLVASVLANPESSEAVLASARQLDTLLAEAGGTLVVRADGEANAGAAVSVDGRQLPAERALSPRHETVGTHAVSITRADGSTEEQSTDVTQGQTATVTFAAPLLGGPDAGGEGGGGFVGSTPFWIIVGASAAVVLLVIVGVAIASGDDSVGGDYDPAVLRF